MAGLWLVLLPDWGQFYGLIGDCFVLYFMASLCTVLWPNWGTVFYGYFRAGLWTILWPNLRLFWDPFCGWFVDCFMA